MSVKRLRDAVRDTRAASIAAASVSREEKTPLPTGRGVFSDYSLYTFFLRRTQTVRYMPQTIIAIKKQQADMPA